MEIKRKKLCLFLIFLISVMMFQSFYSIPVARATTVRTADGTKIWLYDDCESLSTWVIPTGGGLLLNATAPPQGNYSIQSTTTASSWYQYNSTNLMNLTYAATGNTNTLVLGCWLWIPPGAPTTYVQQKVQLGAKGGVSVDAMSNSITWQSGYNWTFNCSPSLGPGSVSYTPGDWVWVEQIWDDTANTVKCYINGSAHGTYSGQWYIFGTDYKATLNPSVYCGRARGKWDYIRLANATQFPPEDPLVAEVEADLEDIDTGPDWVFTDWRYYTFTATIPEYMYSGAPDYVAMMFTVQTSEGNVICMFSRTGAFNWLCWSNASEDRSLDPVRLKTGINSSSDLGWQITFPIWFTPKCLDVYDLADAISVYMIWNDTTGAWLSDWVNAAPEYFRIYNKGGFCQNTTISGVAAPLYGGGHFAMYAGNNSYIYRDWWFRDVQHMKILPEVQFYAGYQTFYIRFGVDYSLGNNIFLKGWDCSMEASYVSYTGVFAANVWMNWTVNWHNRGYSMKDPDYVYMFYHGDIQTAGDIGKTRFWIDLWFNAINASSTGGGRINAYEFPMQDTSALWLRWLSSNWGVKDNVKKESMYMGDLLAPGVPGTADILSSEKIKMIKYWMELEVIPYETEPPGQMVLIDNIDVEDLTYSKSLPLTGIQTPVFDETKMPVVGNTGVLGAIFSMFAGIGKWIGDNILFGGLSLWPMFVAFLDTIAGWLGMPSGFSNFILWLGTGWGWLVSSFTYALTIIYDVFLFLGSVMAAIIFMIGQAIVSFVNVIGMIAGFLSGTVGGAAELWNTLGLTTWITVAIIFYPLYLIILWDQKGMDAVLAQLGMIWGIISWLAHFFITVITLVINIIGNIIESIPVVE